MNTIELLETRIAPAAVFAVDTANNLLVFDSALPGTVSAPIAITGLAASETIEGIDVRPATGELYALGIVDGSGGNPDTGRLYRIDPQTGVASLVGPGPFSTSLPDALRYGFDFNPTVDRIRLVSDAETNLRLHPTTGAVAGSDTDLSPAGGVVAAAYDRNFFNTTATTLFGIDSSSNNLVLIGGVDGSPSPNGGAVTVVGSLGVNATNLAGFDIQDVNRGLAALSVGAASQLFTVDLSTGAATLVGNIAGANAIVGLTFAPPQVKIVNGSTATYTDADGDLVTLKTNRGTLTAELFQLAIAGPGERGQLQSLDLTGAGFKGSSLTVSVTRGTAGDGLAAIGFIDAAGNDLAAVKIAGDLGRIDAGDTNAPAAAVASLSVHSLGRHGIATGAPDLHSSIRGKLGQLTVAQDIRDAFIEVIGADGSLGRLTIGGSLVGGAAAKSGRIEVDGDLGPAMIRGDIVGGAGSGSGQVVVEKDLLSFTMGGSLLGSSSDGGRISVSGAILQLTISGDVVGSTGMNGARVQAGSDPSGTILIKGDVRGGAGAFSGAVSLGSTARSLTIGGSVIGGASSFSGHVQIGEAGLASNTLTIGGDLLGGTGPNSGAINISGELKKLTVRGSVAGGTATISGTILSVGPIGALTIGRDLLGGHLASGAANLDSTGVVRAMRIGSVFVGGSVIAGVDNSAVGSLTKSGGIVVQEDLGAVSIKGSLLGSTGAGGDVTRAAISALGQAAVTGNTDIAIKSLSIGRRVENADIRAGYSLDGSARNADAQIGKVTVGGSWATSNLIAGVSSADSNFGDNDDIKIDEMAATGSPDAANIVSRIGAIVIRGEVFGTQIAVNGSDHFGFVAQQIESLTVGLKRYLFVAGAANGPDLLGYVVGNNSDVRAREVAL